MQDSASYDLSVASEDGLQKLVVHMLKCMLCDSHTSKSAVSVTKYVHSVYVLVASVILSPSTAKTLSLLWSWTMTYCHGG